MFEGAGLVLVLCLLTGSTTAVPVNNKEGMIMEFQARVGMAIPRKISFLEESRSRGIAINHSLGIEEDKIYPSGFRGISRS